MLRKHRSTHGAIWRTLALAIPLILVAGLYIRLRAPAADAPVRLAPPIEETAR
jgi:hypothetical protein